MNEVMKGKVVVIAGAMSGIGKVAAENLALRTARSRCCLGPASMMQVKSVFLFVSTFQFVHDTRNPLLFLLPHAKERFTIQSVEFAHPDR
jgi:hypothetical protein